MIPGSASASASALALLLHRRSVLVEGGLLPREGTVYNSIIYLVNYLLVYDLD